jgi:hypothetical protein
MTMTTTRCSYCGRENNDTHTFCVGCGNDLQVQTSLPPPATSFHYGIVTALKKFGVYIIVVVLAVVVAGLYGIAHNQISYTVAPEYFTKFKFQRFGFVETPLPERVRASMVGFLASWWMGVPIGLLAGVAGFIHRGASRMLRISLWSLVVIVAFTLLFGLCGLLYGYLQTMHVNVAEYRGWFIPDDVTDLRRFLCAGYMHNSSYLGGVLAIPVAWAFHIVVRARTKDAT